MKTSKCRLIVKYYSKKKTTIYFVKCHTFSIFQKTLKCKNSPRNCCLFAPSGSSYYQYAKLCDTLCHCVKSVQIRSFFWYVFSRIGTEYGDLPCKSPLFSPNTGKYGPEKTPYLDIFRAVGLSNNCMICLFFPTGIHFRLFPQVYETW